jgi:Zn-dependent M28 family amino/carboxypeptidase
MRLPSRLALLLAVVGSQAFGQNAGVGDPPDGISAREIHAHLSFLADDLLEGRGPGSRGGDLAALYIAGQFARAGLEPVGGSYFQRVPLVGTEVDTTSLFIGFEAGSRHLTGYAPEDLVVWSENGDTVVDLTGEVVFVGYGVDAPEYGWDDFEGRDVRGKILLVLIGDPPAPPDEDSIFAGPAMSYYGRWTYKLEEAARRGAAGILIVHSPTDAGYDWAVVRSSWSGERLSLPSRPEEPHALPLAGWVNADFTRRLLAAADLNLSELAVRAARRDFRPIPTGITLRARFRTHRRELETANVVGFLPGTAPDLRDEVVVFTAHYDHLGIGPAVAGDSIYNGAYDNASGVALLLEVAEAFASLERRPDRSLLFLATTAEEAGMLGARHYVREPLFPLANTVACLNIDGANLWGETDDVVAIGAERSTLGQVLDARAAMMGLDLRADPAPEKGLFFRSDHFPFARVGVPALSIAHGLRFRDRPDGWGAEVLDRYEREHYHRPSDEVAPDLDLKGAVQQARFVFRTGLDIAGAGPRPRWLDRTGIGEGPARAPTAPPHPRP